MTGNDQNISVTKLLYDYNKGNEKAYDRLFSLVYNQLKKVAHNIKFRQPEFETLNTTALVHEAYLKLAGNENIQWESRRHFYSLASKAIRHILIDYSRKKLAKKRDTPKDSIEENFQVNFTQETALDIEALEKALKKLEKQNPTISRIVECRFYGGMSIKETAETLNTSESTVKRSWAMGKLWLHREIKKIQQPQHTY